MALRMSKALRNFVATGGSLRQALNGGKMKIFTGSQPSLPDDAETGTLLVTITKSGSAHTAEVLASGTVQLTGGGSGTVHTLTANSIDVLGAAVVFDTSLTQTAANIATQVNRNPQNLLYKATSSGTVVTLTAKPGVGDKANGHVLGGSNTTITRTDGTVTGGTTPVNGLNWEPAATGTMVKRTDETWQGTAVASGTAGWFRWVAGVTDAGASDGAEAIIRLDGAVATSGGQLNMSSTTVSSGAVQTVSSDQIIIPAS